jgi:dTDP-4-dehydrorhamnose 3,5-epimerase
MSAAIEPLALEGALRIIPQRHGDARGWFQEHWRQDTLGRRFVQDNLARSPLKGTLRGLHFQRPPNPQAKLISVISGAILDVIVDVREGSPGYGQHLAMELRADNPAQLFVPEGFLHGYVTLAPNTVIAYKVTNYYDRALDGAIAWNDPALRIDWGIAEPLISAKDLAAPRLEEIAPPFTQGWEARCRLS